MVKGSPPNDVCVPAPMATVSGVDGMGVPGPPATPIDQERKCLSRATNVPVSRPRGTRQAPRVLRCRSAALSVSPTTIDPLSVLSCLLYTSDAADDLLCVDLGGRRI